MLYAEILFKKMFSEEPSKLQSNQAMITMKLLCLMVEEDLRFTRMGIWWRGIWFINKTVPLYGGWIVYLYHDL